jgi:hypothetical protein
MMSDPYATFDLRWAFRDEKPEAIEEKYAQLLGKLAPMRGRRVFFHTGVDVNVFLPSLAWAFEAAAEAVLRSPPAESRRSR